MTKACGWAAFKMHISVWILASERANLMAVEVEEGGEEHGWT